MSVKTGKQTKTEDLETNPHIYDLWQKWHAGGWKKERIKTCFQ